MHYTTQANVLDYLGYDADDIDTEELDKQISRAETDVDNAVGLWTLDPNTGMKLTGKRLSPVQASILSRAVCKQVEYRLTLGEDFMIREQHDATASPAGSVNGTVAKVPAHVYGLLQSAGLLKLYGSTGGAPASLWDRTLPRA